MLYTTRMASIDVRTPAERMGGLAPQYNRRGFLAAALATIGASIAAIRAGCKYVETERMDMYQLVKKFPTGLKGIHRVEPFPVPGAEQCILRFVHMHPQAENHAALANVQPDVIRSWENCGNEIASAIADLQQRYPAYALREVFCEGVRSASADSNTDEPMEECIANVRRIWGQDASLEELWRAAIDERNDAAYAFLVRCGAVAEPVLRGDLTVHGIASEDLDARIAPLMKHRDKGTISPSGLQQLQELLEKYEEHALDQIQKSGGEFPILPIGDWHDMAAAIDRRQAKHPDESPFSLVNIWPNETAKQWDKHLAVNNRHS